MHFGEPRETTLSAAWAIQAWGERNKTHPSPSLALPETTLGNLPNSSIMPLDALGSAERASEDNPDSQAIQSNTPWPAEKSGAHLSCIPLGVLGKNISGYPAQEILQLEQHGWIHLRDNAAGLSRVYVVSKMTDRRNQQKSHRKLRSALKQVMSIIDSSVEAWEGRRPPTHGSEINNQKSQDESLWYIFNTLDNPSPDPAAMRDPWSRRAMEDLLSDEDFSDLGLKTRLYPYQRRSAATMVQRESQPAQMLDPRLQAWKSPAGLVYYYDQEQGVVTQDKAMYSEACGGILAETMGCGKTLICLAVIWATRGHVPKIPIEYLSSPDRPSPIPVRKTTGSLMCMAAAAAGRHSEPWRAFFLEKQQEGTFYSRCIEACEDHAGSYEIPSHQSRYQGRQKKSYPRPPAKHIRLCSGTLVVVPNNLVDHWEHQIQKHTEGLKVKVLRRSSDKTPPAEELLKLDIVLFAKTRFEAESGEQVDNRRDSFVQVDSPLSQLHWLRVIVDEGENVAGQGTRMTHIFGQLHFERRWVVSGTPADGLYGVEVSLASQEASDSDNESPEEVAVAVLQTRKKTGTVDETEMKALDRLRRIVIEFLDLKPWSNPPQADRADWTTYIKPIGKDGKRRKTPAIRATLQGLMVRHRYETVEREVELPRLYNHVKYLEPRFHDRLSINLFLFGLAVNAITSERQGSDYMFDSSNRKHLNQTINNLRQAGFWWAGSNEEDVQKTVDVALKYLEESREKMTAADIEQLTRGIDVARRILSCSTWREFKHLHELGIFIKNFPEEHREQWALDPSKPQDPFLLGITQACKVQQHVTKNLRLPDPTTGLSGAGIRFRAELVENARTSSDRSASDSVSSSSAGQLSHSTKPPNKKSPKKTFTQNIFRSLAEDSHLMKTMFVGTASAKLTYLLDKVTELQKEEKIIIFYDNMNSAYWIAEGLELLGIEFRIYASSLKTEQRTEYLEIFRESDHVRVLLMDLRQASHGLHLAQASRVFIINPIWQPNVESQAIKRAHRIGQTRPVYVETLVLQNTLEDRMLRRRKEMSEAEMQQAEKSLLDDNAMSDIIQNEPFLELGDEAESGVAWLDHPTPFFDRHRLPIPDDEEVGMRSPSKRARAPVANGVDSDAAGSAPKRSRIGFAADVQVLGEQSPSQEGSRSSNPSFVGLDGQSERRVSLFGS